MKLLCLHDSVARERMRHNSKEQLVDWTDLPITFKPPHRNPSAGHNQPLTQHLKTLVG